MYEQVKLRYSFSDLEPHIDEETMITHYSKHHAAYTKNFNDAIKELGWEDKSLKEVFTSLDQIEDIALRNKTRNNGGGYYNHNVYFDMLSPNGSKPSGRLKAKIDETFGSCDKLKELLIEASMSVFGSGWAWLSMDENGDLIISTTEKQDNPIMISMGKLRPIVAIDVWEHAYYLKHKNMRADYLDDLMQVICWNHVSEIYENNLI